jgi:hypothetical protein
MSETKYDEKMEATKINGAENGPVSFNAPFTVSEMLARAFVQGWDYHNVMGAAIPTSGEPDSIPEREATRLLESGELGMP